MARRPNRLLAARYRTERPPRQLVLGKLWELTYVTFFLFLKIKGTMSGNKRKINILENKLICGADSDSDNSQKIFSFKKMKNCGKP